MAFQFSWLKNSKKRPFVLIQFSEALVEILAIIQNEVFTKLASLPWINARSVHKDLEV